MSMIRKHPTRKFPGKLGKRPDRFNERKLDSLAREAMNGKSQQRERRAR
jgi:hypothetical protein